MAKISIIAFSAVVATASAGSLRGLTTEPAAATEPATATNPTKLGGSGSMPPAYLSVPNFESCLAKETVGTSEQWCIPAAKPSTCVDSSWGEISKENMSLTACASDDKSGTKDVGGDKMLGADPATYTPKNLPQSDDEKMLGADPATYTPKNLPQSDDEKMLGPEAPAAMYKQKMDAFMKSHKAEIDAFVSEHKEAIDEAKADIAKAIENKDFDFENYQDQLKQIVDKHDLAAYKAQFEKYVEGHKAEIKQFVSENKDMLKDVEDKIKVAVASGQFDFTHYQQQLQAFINQYDLQKYQKEMDSFVTEHKAAIEKFVAANKQAVEDVQKDIADLVKTGSFDFKNFESQIQDLVTKYDKGLSKYSPTDEQKQEISDAIDTAKNSKAGKTLADYVKKVGDAEEKISA